jgi:hypothetical protein
MGAYSVFVSNLKMVMYLYIFSSHPDVGDAVLVR